MKKLLVFVAFLAVSQANITQAQIFNIPDTVCIRQPVTLTSTVSANSYYWGFCSGYLLNAPAGTRLPADTNFKAPAAIVIEKDGPDYFGFVANHNDKKIVRLAFGTSLSNIPVKTVITDLEETLPERTSKLFLIKNAAGNWFLFAAGGANTSNSSLARLDFGSSLSNTPNIVNFGNFGGLLNAPRGLFIQETSNGFIGYMANNSDNKLLMLSFGSDISLTPNITDLGNSFKMAGPSDMVPVLDNNEWNAFVTNRINNTITRLNFGGSLENTPAATAHPVTGNPLNEPSSLTYVKDCDAKYLLVVSETTEDLNRIDINVPASSTYPGRAYTADGTLSKPLSISHLVRERDNLYAYVTNSDDTSITQISFAQCTSSSILSSTATNPPAYSYHTPGIYNVYLAINEGRPDMQVECRQIFVQPIPELTLSSDTVICQGDTVLLSVRSLKALDFTWSPDYNISKTDSFDVRVAPEYSTGYRLVMPYASGCIVDTTVHVTVSKNRADAGPDRMLGDGAKTILGGPMTSLGEEFTYTWLPSQFISDVSDPNPVVNPPYDYTYYLEVRNNFGCYDIDTVVVRVTCNDLNLPNAFAPESQNAESNSFGLKNRQIIKLNYLRVFDRWGRLVFETTDGTKRWDGKINGEPAPFGVYVWEADGFCIENKRFKRSGNVTLIR